MRLINVETYELKEFFSRDCPTYAILSHTWEQDEVLFRDMQPDRLAAAHVKRGFAKIRHCCQQAQYDGYGWAWVDTCCIDKSSSAELSETINSMFGYYERAGVCYAYLGDMTVDDLELCSQDGRPIMSVDKPLDSVSIIKRTKWWTRGWTLQEFLAPMNVVFYDSMWNYVTSKTHWRGCKTCLPESSNSEDRSFGMQRDVVLKSRPLSTIPIHVRMQWSSTRMTTRVEDQAYCLLGIFDVNMPLLYGEGGKAFLRFQEILLAETGDYSLLAWGGPGKTARTDTFSGIFAPSPIFFNALDSEAPFHNSPLRVTSKHTIAGNTATICAKVTTPTSIMDIQDAFGDVFANSSDLRMHWFHANTRIVALPLYKLKGSEKHHPIFLCLERPSVSRGEEYTELVRHADILSTCSEDSLGDAAGKGWSSWTDLTFVRSCQVSARASGAQPGQLTFGSRFCYWATRQTRFQWRRPGRQQWEVANDWAHGHPSGLSSYIIFILREKVEEGRASDDMMADNQDSYFGPVICCLREDGSISIVESSSEHPDPDVSVRQWIQASLTSYGSMNDPLASRVQQGGFYEFSIGSGSMSAPIAERDFQLPDGQILVVKAVAKRVEQWSGIPLYNVYLWLSIRD